MYSHSEKLVAMAPALEQEHGRIHPLPTHDNQRCAFLIERNPCDGFLQLQLDGEVLAESHGVIHSAWSPDGKKLATLHPTHENGEGCTELRINGKPYPNQEPRERYHLGWLGKDQLAWSEYKEEGRRNHFLVNGEDVTGKLKFQQVLLDRNITALFVELPEEGLRYTVFEDGTHSEKEPIRAFKESMEDPNKPEYSTDEKTGKGFVRFRGQNGPLFDEIRLEKISKTADGMKIGYCGLNHHPVVKFLGEKIIQFTEQLFKDGAGWNEKNKNDPPFLLKAAVLLMNPYFGPAHVFANVTQRFYPVVNDRAWKRGYRQVDDGFFTPNGRFVVKAWSPFGNRQRLVIDGHEGPLFDEIAHVRYLKSEQCISYLGRRGTSYSRVAVSSIFL